MGKSILLISSIIVSFIYIRPASAAMCFNRAGRHYGIEPALLIAIARVESDFNPKAIDWDTNGTYDYGVMQINTVWYPQIKKIWHKLNNPCQNVAVGAWILRQCIDRFDGIKNAVACYHTGGGSVQKARGYVNAVMAYYRKYKYYSF